MHPSALENARKFVNSHLAELEKGIVLDVGAADINGTLRPLVEDAGHQYTGLDLEDGPNVDVAAPEKPWPFEDGDFDAVVTSSTLEHDPAFWETFREMVRVTRPGGLIYCCAPSAGPYHAHPVDCWRFQADAWRALADFAGVELLESYVDRSDRQWHDSVGIFRKPEGKGGSKGDGPKKTSGPAKTETKKAEAPKPEQPVKKDAKADERPTEGGVRDPGPAGIKPPAEQGFTLGNG